MLTRAGRQVAWARIRRSCFPDVYAAQASLPLLLGSCAKRVGERLTRQGAGSRAPCERALSSALHWSCPLSSKAAKASWNMLKTPCRIIVVSSKQYVYMYILPRTYLFRCRHPRRLMFLCVSRPNRCHFWSVQVTRTKNLKGKVEKIIFIFACCTHHTDTNTIT